MRRPRSSASAAQPLRPRRPASRGRRSRAGAGQAGSGSGRSAVTASACFRHGRAILMQGRADDSRLAAGGQAVRRAAPSGDLLQRDRGRDAQGVADLARQVRAVQGVEVQILAPLPRSAGSHSVGAVGQRQQLFAPVAGGQVEGFVQPLRAHGRRSGRRTSSRPSQLVIGRMPGMIGAVMPASAQASRKRRKVSASKKNWVMALEAPASILRLSQCTSAVAVGGIGVRFGVGADAERELAGRGQRLDQLDRVGEALGMRGEAGGALRRVAAQRDDLGHAGLGIGLRRSPAFRRGWHRRRSGAPPRSARSCGGWCVTASCVSLRVVPPAP